jgi:hypothetical protein
MKICNSDLHPYMMAMHMRIQENTDFQYIWNAEQIWWLVCMLFECFYLQPDLLQQLGSATQN